MLMIISPAKRLNFETSAPTKNFTEPKFIDHSKELVGELKKISSAKLGELFGVSKKIADLNYERFQSFKTPLTLDNAKQALFSFEGDTYVGLQAKEFSAADIKYAQKKLRILSGLYGVLAPLDLMLPYRLEMGTKWGIKGCKDLYEYWQETVTAEMNATLAKEKSSMLVNLASKEYFSAINFKALNATVITPIFKQSKKGTTNPYKIQSMFAKKARGQMASFIIRNKIVDVESLKDFNVDGYRLAKRESDDQQLVFHRKY